MERTAPDVVVHDGDPVKDLCKADDIGEGRSVLVVAPEGPDLGRGRDLRAGREDLAEELEEDEVVGRVLRRPTVALDAALGRVLPVDVDSVEAVLVVDGEHLVGEIPPVPVGRDGGREVAASGSRAVSSGREEEPKPKGTHAEPVQPPMESLIFLPAAWPSRTVRRRRSSEFQPVKTRLRFESRMAKAGKRESRAL